MNESPKLDFAMVMASAVHDMKNSLSMVLHSLEQLSAELKQDEHLSHQVGILQYEASRVTNDLVQLLGIYRLQRQQLPIRIDEYFVHDFLDEQIARYQPLFEGRNVTCELICDDSLVGYFDHELLAGIISNVIANTIRYTKDQIRIEAEQANDYLKISISDNGPGFPQRMLQMPEQLNLGINFETGSTHLGLYFAGEIAKLHQQSNRRGYIELSNGGALGGGVFSLYLP